MADEKEEEPSIEEILDSIRQIISDDDEDGEAAVAEAPEEPVPVPEPEPEPEPEIVAEPEPAPAPQPEPEPDIALEDIEEEEDVLELTPEMQQPVAEPPKATEEVAEEVSILSDEAKSAALASMAKLASSMPVSRRPGYEGVTVEDIVRELLNPVIREWADGHLQDVVEKVVQKEISKLASRALDE